MSNPNSRTQLRNQSLQLAGLLLWRAGLLLAGTTGLYRIMRILVRFIELPRQLEIGASLILSGAVLFMVSLIMERMADAKLEGDLKQ